MHPSDPLPARRPSTRAQKALLAIGLVPLVVLFALANPITTVLAIAIGVPYVGYRLARAFVGGVITGVDRAILEAEVNRQFDGQPAVE